MSETTSPIASAMAAMDAADSPATAPEPVQQPDSTPQADDTAEQAAQTTEAPAPSEDDSTADLTDAPETKPSRGDKRFQQLLQERHALRERLAYLEGVAQRQQAPAEPVKQAAPMLPPDVANWVGPEPDANAFPAGEFDPQYLRAIAKYEVRSEQAQILMAQQQHAARQAEQAKAQTFHEAAAKVAAERPDFREVVGLLGQSVHDQVANMIADAGPEVAYAIAKDAAAAAQVRAARTPDAVARVIGRFEERLSAKPAAPVAPSPQPSAAPPPPPKAVRGASSAGFDWSKASPAEIQARINGS